MKIFDRIKNSILEEVERQKGEQQKKEEKLVELEKIQNQKNFRVLHPVQAGNNRKEIKRLKREIKEYNDKKKSRKTLVGIAGLLVVLFAFIGIMSAIDGEDSTYTNTDDYNYTDEFYDETAEETSEDEILENQTDFVVEEIIAEDMTIQTETTEITEHIHEYQNATCSTPMVCISCGDEVGLPTNHDYVQGSCSFCGEKDPDYASEEMVWIPTNGGRKYHRRGTCSNMEDPIYVTVTEAKNQGFTACGRCY